MLKKVSVILFAVLLVACVSEPVENGFKGTGDFDKAEAAKTRVSLGLTYLKNGNFSQAKFNLDKALEFDPRSGKANFAMAFYYQQVDEVERAHSYYKQAINYSSNDPDILNSYGAFLCKQGDYKQAKKFFLQSVDDKSYISTASTYENLAICSENQGEIEEAITYFNSALNHQPTRATSLLYLSQLYVQTERWEDAKKSLWKYERNASVTSESLWLSFQIARGQQDLRAAVEYAEILKRLHPNDPNSQKAINELGKFQPDMAVTKKTRDMPQSVQMVSTTDIGNQQETQLNTAGSKTLRILTPQVDNASASASSNISLEPVGVVENVPAMPEVFAETEIETDSNVESETEQALRNALDNNDASTQSAANDVAPEVTNDIVDSVDDLLAVNEASVVDEISDAQINADTPFHIVAPKENLYRISLKYNVKIKKLLEWNKLADASSIRIGTKLWVRDPNINE